VTEKEFQEEIDCLHGLIDNFSRAVVDLAYGLGQFEWANAWVACSNDILKEIVELRAKRSKPVEEQTQ